MPSLQSLVTTINSDYCPEKGRPTVLSLVERAIKALFNQPCASSIFYNRSDPAFPFPIINTVSGTLSYELTAANLVNSAGAAVALTVNGTTVALRDIAGVFVKGSSIGTGGYTPNFRGSGRNVAGINPYWGNNNAQSYYQVPGVPTPKTNNEALAFTFLENPGTSSNRFFVEAYYEHPDLAVDTDPVLINLQLWEQAIIDGCIAYLEDFDNGNAGTTPRINKFEQYWKPKFSTYGNKDISHRSSMQIPIRECG
jgi:hypothetical protein